MNDIEDVHVQCCFTSTETIRTLRNEGALDVLSSVFQCCFTSTETIRTIRNEGALDGHLHFHTAPELCLGQMHRWLRMYFWWSL